MIKRRCRYNLDGRRESQPTPRNVQPVYYDKMKAERKEYAELLNLGSVDESLMEWQFTVAQRCR